MPWSTQRILTLHLTLQASKKSVDSSQTIDPNDPQSNQKITQLMVRFTSNGLHQSKLQVSIFSMVHFQHFLEEGNYQ